MRILVTGASGFIGSRLCRRLVGVGHDVLALMRPRLGDCRYPPGEVVYGHLPYDIPPAVFTGLHAIVHCAGTTRGQKEAEAWAVNVETTRVLCEYARNLPQFHRFVFISSQSAHEQAISAYGRTKLAAEGVVKRSGVPYVIVRPGLVFGAGDAGLFSRMRETLSRLPILPLLGGGRTPVQPIEVEDLCTAIASCLDLPREDSFEFNLGEPVPITMAEFLQATAEGLSGRRKLAVPIPLGPIKAMVSLAEGLRFPLPISSENLRGMEVVQPMETRSSLERLNLNLKTFETAIREAARDATDTALIHRPLRIMLVGTGKIGIVHAIDVTQRAGLALCAAVDPNPKAFRLYEKMGFRCRYYTDLQEAIRAARPDAAIVATPAATHYELTRQCLAAGLDVLVEKPLAVSRDVLSRYAELGAMFPQRVCHVGYMATQFPQLDPVAEALQAKRLGAIRAVWVTALQSHIMAPKPMRWEMVKTLSGGGVLINFAIHLLAILFRLFGAPRTATADLWSIYSTEVEDAADVTIDFGGFSARLVTSWSAPGYARPLNRIIIECESGEIQFENFFAMLRPASGKAEIYTQCDFDVGYNMAPDYTGGAFAREHINFAEAIRSRQVGQVTTKCPSQSPVYLPEAILIEEFIHELYRQAESPRPEKTIVPQLVASRYATELDNIAKGLRRR